MQPVIKHQGLDRPAMPPGPVKCENQQRQTVAAARQGDAERPLGVRRQPSVKNREDRAL